MMLMQGGALECMQMMVIEGKCRWTKVDEALHVSIQFKQTIYCRQAISRIFLDSAPKGYHQTNKDYYQSHLLTR